MVRKYSIDSQWFHQQLVRRGKSLRGLAKFMQMDPAAVSRMLNGQRNMSADEQDHIARFLGVDLQEIALHRGGLKAGFEEEKQDAYVADTSFAPVEEVAMFTAGAIIFKEGQRWIEGPDGLLPLHPIFGCMKGTMNIPADLDLTAPIDFEWSDKLYNE